MIDPSELFPEVDNLYEFPSVHQEMIFDEQRVDAYDRAIRQVVNKGDTVIDIGTGTGILAFLCLRAGAARVHAIDRSPVIELAKRLAEANGFADRIVFHQCDSREVEIEDSADVIVSELIGHMAFEEGMVESISDAKKRMLKHEGTLIPKAVTLYAAPVYEREVYASCIDGWKAAYGIDYSVMREQALATSYVTEISENDLLAKHQPVFSIDFHKKPSIEVNTERTFEIHRSGEINGIAFWFDSLLTDVVRLSSGPWSKTHWRQCFTPLSEPRKVTAGEQLPVSFAMALRNRKTDRFSFKIAIQ